MPSSAVFSARARSTRTRPSACLSRYWSSVQPPATAARASVGEVAPAGRAPGRRCRRGAGRPGSRQPRPGRRACPRSARGARRERPAGKLPGPAARSPAISPATPTTRRAATAASNGVGFEGREGGDERRGGAAHGRDAAHQRDGRWRSAITPLAVGDEIRSPVTATTVSFAPRKGGDGIRASASPGSAANSAGLQRRIAGRRSRSARARVEARRRGVDEDGIEHPGTAAPRGRRRSPPGSRRGGRRRACRG